MRWRALRGTTTLSADPTRGDTVSTVKTLATDQISARQTAGTHRFPQRLAPSSRVYATTDQPRGAPREPIDERSAKPRQTFNRAKVLLIVADVVAVALAVLATYTLEIAWLGNDNGETARFLSVALLSLPAWLVIFTHQRLYNTRFIGRRIDEMRTHRERCGARRDHDRA